MSVDKKKLAQAADNRKKVIQKIGYMRIGLAVVLILAVVVVALSFVGKNNDKQRFVAAHDRGELAVSLLAQSIKATPSGEEIKDTCYDAEQGPYDNGKLWCQTTAALYYTDVLGAQNIETEMRKIISDQKWDITNSRASNVEFDGGANVPCELNVITDARAQKPGNYLQGDMKAKTAVILNCADRAKAKHYQFKG
jgi:hypothetical protein